MASIEKRGKVYRVKVYVGRKDGKQHFESFTARTKAEASAWALRRESELDGSILPTKTLKEALERYAKTVSPERKGERWEVLRLKAIGEYELARKPIAKVTTDDLIEWRDTRLTEVSKATVLREMNLLVSVFKFARREWRWIRTDPLKDVSKPTAPPSRKRRVTQAEIDAIVRTAKYDGGAPKNLTHIAVMSFLFAIETAMRSGEILGLTWDAVDEKKVYLPETKNGDTREVALSQRAREIIEIMRSYEKPFPIAAGTRDALFRRLVKDSGVQNLHYHDARAEAIYRLSKKLSVLSLAQMVGHKDIKSLMLYYREAADDMADKL